MSGLPSRLAPIHLPNPLVHQPWLLPTPGSYAPLPHFQPFEFSFTTFAPNHTDSLRSLVTRFRLRATHPHHPCLALKQGSAPIPPSPLQSKRALPSRAVRIQLF